MADITVTPASVVPAAACLQRSGIAGEAILAGQSIALSSVDGKYYKADNNGAAAIQRCDGVALNSAPGAGQPVNFITQGGFNPGATVVVGTIYVVSTTPGGICPAADLASGSKVCIIGVGTTASNIDTLLHNSGASVP